MRVLLLRGLLSTIFLPHPSQASATSAIVTIFDASQPTAHRGASHPSERLIDRQPPSPRVRPPAAATTPLPSEVSTAPTGDAQLNLEPKHLFVGAYASSPRPVVAFDCIASAMRLARLYLPAYRITTSRLNANAVPASIPSPSLRQLGLFHLVTGFPGSEAAKALPTSMGHQPGSWVVETTLRRPVAKVSAVKRWSTCRFRFYLGIAVSSPWSSKIGRSADPSARGSLSRVSASARQRLLRCPPRVHRVLFPRNLTLDQKLTCPAIPRGVRCPTFIPRPPSSFCSPISSLFVSTAMTDTRSLRLRLISNEYVIGCFATIGGGLFGLDISSMSGQLNNPYYLTAFKNPGPNLQGGIVASMPAGSFAGSLINSYLADKLGRKYCICVSGCLWILGAIIQSAAHNVTTLIAGRVIAGLSVGIASSIIPIYIAEIAKPSIRGRLVGVQQWAITWGIFFQFFVQYGCSFIAGTASFRLPWALQLIPALLLVLGMILLPESPRWLMDKGREEEALKLLADIHGKGDPQHELVQLEYLEMKQAVEFDNTLAARSYFDLLKPGIGRRVFIGMSVQMWSQLTGMNVMMYYIVYVFQSAGITGRRGSLIASSVQWVLNVVMTVPALIYIDKWGRRPMMLVGSTFMGIFLFLVGGLMGRFGHLSDVSAGSTWTVTGHPAATNGIIVCSYFFVCSYASTWGPVSWAYPSEIFPTRVRGKAVSITTATNWAFNFALAYFAPPALANIQYRTYYLFGAFNVAMTIHVFFCFPETKGRTLEEMEVVFESGNHFTAWRLNSHVGKQTLADITGTADDKVSKHTDTFNEKLQALEDGHQEVSTQREL